MPEDCRDSFYEARFDACLERYPVRDELSPRVLLDLVRTADLIHQVVARSFAEFGLSKSTYNILLFLQHAPPEGMQLHELGERLLVSRANVTGLIHHLEQKGYVTRDVPARDRRVRCARLTPKARDLLDRVTPIHLRNLGILLKDVSKRDKQNLRELLKSVRESLEKNAPNRIRNAGPLRQAASASNSSTP